jgi:uncharacterized coiled-coil DUF342 family protein
MKRKPPNEELITAESELDEARRRLKLASQELIDADHEYDKCRRRFEALSESDGAEHG